MITTPEIQKLQAEEQSMRKLVGEHVLAIRDLRSKERQRIHAEKGDKKSNAHQIAWCDSRKMKAEIRRLRVLLAESMKECGKNKEEIECATHVKTSTLYSDKGRVERDQRSGTRY